MSDQDSQLLLINKQTLTDIANAIREKTGKTDKIYPSNMDEEILSITTGSNESHPPITVSITQSEHQTITANSRPNLSVINGKIVCPDSIMINASITADSGYTPGTLNQTSINATWGDTVTFSATPATEISYQPNMQIDIISDTLDIFQYQVRNTGNTVIRIDSVLMNDIDITNYLRGSNTTTVYEPGDFETDSIFTEKLPIKNGTNILAIIGTNLYDDTSITFTKTITKNVSINLSYEYNGSDWILKIYNSGDITLYNLTIEDNNGGDDYHIDYISPDYDESNTEYYDNKLNPEYNAYVTMYSSIESITVTAYTTDDSNNFNITETINVNMS